MKPVKKEVEKVPIGEIRLNTVQRSNDMLHQVTMAAEQELHDEKFPHPEVKTEAELKKERYQQAEELDQEAISLDRMNFSAHDLNSFTGMTTQNGDHTYEELAPAQKPKMHAQVDSHKKSFFEEIYEKTSH